MRSLLFFLRPPLTCFCGWFAFPEWYFETQAVFCPIPRVHSLQLSPHTPPPTLPYLHWVPRSAVAEVVAVVATLLIPGEHTCQGWAGASQPRCCASGRHLWVFSPSCLGCSESRRDLVFSERGAWGCLPAWPVKG